MPSGGCRALAAPCSLKLHLCQGCPRGSCGPGIIRALATVRLLHELQFCLIFPSLILEWNSLGVWEEGFSFFCQGLGANNSLQRLDLRNNQINHQGAGELAMALKHNSSLQELGKSDCSVATPTSACTHVCIVRLAAACRDLCQLVPVPVRSRFLSAWSTLQALCRE